MSITRKLPNTHITRENALIKAAQRQAGLPATDQVLTPSTVTRLTAMEPTYTEAMGDVNKAQAALSANTPDKDKAVQEARMFNSHFIQVFNLGVARGKYPAGHRAYYGLQVDSSALPPMDTETDVLNWGARLINGDADRTGAGGAAMANPDIAEVQAAHTAASAPASSQDVLKEQLDIAQEKLAELSIGADSLIKRIWDEVETFYGEELPASKRANARLWGVVYVSNGPKATLTGLVKDATGQPRAGAEVELLETDAKATANAEGRYTIQTSYVGTATLQASWPGLPPAQTTIDIAEHDTAIQIDVAELVVG